MIAARIAAELEESRAATLASIDELDDDALRAQPHPSWSPIGWHLGHVAFTEARWILGRLCGDDSLVSPFARAWAQGGSPKHERRAQPAKSVILSYMAEVRERVLARLSAFDLEGDDPLLARGFVFWLVASHEHQHRETITVVRQLALEKVAVCEPPPAPSAAWKPPPMRFIEGGRALIGTDDALAYDNERPAHEVWLESFCIDTEPASVAALEAFRADGGYARRELWSEEGWRWRERENVRAPRGWTCDGEGRLSRVRLDGVLAPLAPDEAAFGLSFYEAEAFARWRGARLPTEAEWEHARSKLEGIGRVWEWTASPFAPYPGFRAFPYRGYSVPYFDGVHRVLRGGSFATHARIARPTFRNWYEPWVREIVAGVRCAR